MKLILPKTLIKNDGNPTFFLAGPIKGGGDWQRRCCLRLEEMIHGEFTVVVPCRWGVEHPLYKNRALGTEDYFPRQTLWERHYLEQASKHGSIIVWLPCEDRTDPRTDGQPYARDTYGELGEWRGRLMCDREIHLTLGAEANFPGLDVISQNFRSAIGASFPIFSTLEGTLQVAVAKSLYKGVLCSSCNQVPRRTGDSYECPYCGEKFTHLTD